MSEAGDRLDSDPARIEKVLVVDDDAINRELLRGLLETNHYEVNEGKDGAEAIRLAAAWRPDCILLDLVMPNLNGADACRAIKNSTETAIIPVIVLTAYEDQQARIEAIKAGADDFLKKPYDPDEVLLRVRNSIRMKRLYDRAQDDLRRLRELEGTKEGFTHMLIHDLRQPLTGIKAYSDYLKLSAGYEMSPRVEDSLQKINELVDRAESMIANILDITRLEDGRMPIKYAPHDLQEILSQPIENARQSAMNNGITLDFRPIRCVVRCDRDLVRRIAENLLSNAIKHSDRGSTVLVGMGFAKDSGEFYVTDQGDGIPLEFHKLIFEKYGQVQMRAQKAAYSSGLGLAFCKLAAEANGGGITVASSPGNGATFRVQLPTGGSHSEQPHP